MDPLGISQSTATVPDNTAIIVAVISSLLLAVVLTLMILGFNRLIIAANSIQVMKRVDVSQKEVDLVTKGRGKNVEQPPGVITVSEDLTFPAWISCKSGLSHVPTLSSHDRVLSKNSCLTNGDKVILASGGPGQRQAAAKLVSVQATLIIFAMIITGARGLTFHETDTAYHSFVGIKDHLVTEEFSIPMLTIEPMDTWEDCSKFDTVDSSKIFISSRDLNTSVEEGYSFLTENRCFDADIERFPLVMLTDNNNAIELSRTSPSVSPSGESGRWLFMISFVKCVNGTYTCKIIHDYRNLWSDDDNYDIFGKSHYDNYFTWQVDFPGYESRVTAHGNSVNTTLEQRQKRSSNYQRNYIYHGSGGGWRGHNSESTYRNFGFAVRGTRAVINACSSCTGDIRHGQICSLYRCRLDPGSDEYCDPNQGWWKPDDDFDNAPPIWYCKEIVSKIINELGYLKDRQDSIIDMVTENTNTQVETIRSLSNLTSEYSDFTLRAMQADVKQNEIMMSMTTSQGIDSAWRAYQDLAISLTIVIKETLESVRSFWRASEKCNNLIYSKGIPSELYPHLSEIVASSGITYRYEDYGPFLKFFEENGLVICDMTLKHRKIHLIMPTGGVIEEVYKVVKPGYSLNLRSSNYRQIPTLSIMRDHPENGKQVITNMEQDEMICILQGHQCQSYTVPIWRHIDYPLESNVLLDQDLVETSISGQHSTQYFYMDGHVIIHTLVTLDCNYKDEATQEQRKPGIHMLPLRCSQPLNCTDGTGELFKFPEFCSESSINVSYEKDNLIEMVNVLADFVSDPISTFPINTYSHERVAKQTSDLEKEIGESKLRWQDKFSVLERDLEESQKTFVKELEEAERKRASQEYVNGFSGGRVPVGSRVDSDKLENVKSMAVAGVVMGSVATGALLLMVIYQNRALIKKFLSSDDNAGSTDPNALLLPNHWKCSKLFKELTIMDKKGYLFEFKSNPFMLWAVTKLSRWAATGGTWLVMPAVYKWSGSVYKLDIKGTFEKNKDNLVCDFKVFSENMRGYSFTFPSYSDDTLISMDTEVAVTKVTDIDIVDVNDEDEAEDEAGAPVAHMSPRKDKPAKQPKRGRSRGNRITPVGQLTKNRFKELLIMDFQAMTQCEYMYRKSEAMIPKSESTAILRRDFSNYFYYPLTKEMEIVMRENECPMPRDVTYSSTRQSQVYSGKMTALYRYMTGQIPFERSSQLDEHFDDEDGVLCTVSSCNVPVLVYRQGKDSFCSDVAGAPQELNGGILARA